MSKPELDEAAALPSGMGSGSDDMLADTSVMCFLRRASFVGDQPAKNTRVLTARRPFKLT